MRIGNSEVHFVPSLKELGVTLDCCFNMTQHVQNICRSAFIQLRQIGLIRTFLIARPSQTPVCAFLLSRLDYCNCLLSGCPQYLIDRLLTVHNAAAPLICTAKQTKQNNNNNKKPRPCPTYSSVATLVAYQGTNTVYIFHALF